jgi:beta-xylosidase
MKTDNQIKSTHGIVELGDFKEVISIPGRYLNDHCLVLNGDTWHFFGIVGDTGSVGVATELSFAHATSTDLLSWTLHADVLPVKSLPQPVDYVWAPSVMKKGDVFYMLYTAVEKYDKGNYQRICLATSTDLFHWEQYAGNPVIVPSLYWATWPGHGHRYGSCRDPHIMQLPNGRYMAYWVAEMRSQQHFNAEALSCVAASVSDDLVHWQEVGPVHTARFWRSDGRESRGTSTIESPCCVFKDNKYWLFYKHGWWTHGVVSPTPFDFSGGEHFRLGFSHASKIIEWNGQWHITHCSSQPQDYTYENTNRTRGLYIAKLDWPDNAYPLLK